MAQHNELGQQGETIAKEFLISKDYIILEENYRYQRGEIDLIAKDGDTLVFVEVKTSSNNFLFEPEHAVSAKKERLIQNTGLAYMREIGYDWAIRFDVIGIVIRADDRFEIRHTEDAFF